ncbi:MAG: DUF342 domain-containing protein [Candidatus Lindowbacteria bacterium]|nr:DUF342 domain-containing protein [Candidatus Lindowbacteria bacterium]
MATAKGQLFMEEGNLILLPHDDATLAVNVDKDNMTARLTIHPSEGSGKLIKSQNVLDEIRKKGIAEFNMDLVTQAVERSELGEDVDDLIISQGTEATIGKNGYIEYMIKEPEAKRGVPKLLPVSEGDHLATLFPSDPGKPGNDILGNEVSPPNYEEVPIEIGEGVDIEDAEYKENRAGKKILIGGKILAGVNGNLLIRDNLLEVRKVLQYTHDLTAAMGSIEFDGHVIIEGNVGDNVKINALGDIYVSKSVAAASLVAGGNIEVGAGMAGRDRGTLKAEGSVSIQFVERGIIQAKKAIKVANAVMHSQLYAGESIEVLEGKGMFIGGKGTAGEFVKAKVIGSGTGTATRISVGIDPYIEIKVIGLDKELIELRNAVRELQPAIEQIQAMLQQEKSAVLLLKFRELTRRKVMIPHQMKQLLIEREKISKNLFPDVVPYIEAFDQLHLGVTLHIKNEQLVLQAPLLMAQVRRGESGLESVPIRDSSLGHSKVKTGKEGIEVKNVHGGPPEENKS